MSMSGLRSIRSPALLTRMSMPPKRAVTASTSAFTSAALVRSPWNACASTPAAVERRHDFLRAVAALHVVHGDARAALAERHGTGAAQTRAAASHQRHSLNVAHRFIDLQASSRSAPTP